MSWHVLKGNRHAFLSALIMGVAVACVMLSVRRAAAVTFEYRADWYEIDGNRWGLQDGVADVRDDFNNGVVDHPTEFTGGTVSESGGYLSLKDPGEIRSDASRPVTYEISHLSPVFETVPLDGFGDFTATASFFPDAPQPDHFYGLIISNPGDVDPYSNYSIQIGQAGPVFVDTLGMNQGEFAMTMRHLVVNNGVQVDLFEAVVISDFASEVTGNIVMRLDVNDTTREVIGSYSLDGGINFVSPFSSGTLLDVTYNNNAYLVSLMADPVVGAVPEPSTLLLLGTGLAGLVGFGHRRKQG